MILVALGGNTPGYWGSPIQTQKWAMGELANYRIYVTSKSSFYMTKAIGLKGQPDYVNAVVQVQAAMSATNLLKNLKHIERRAGRDCQLKTKGRWGCRPLDLDIVDYKSMVSADFEVCNGERAVTLLGSSTQCKLVFPHPRAHLRPFVIQPIIDINPFWHHPVSGLSALSIAAKLRNTRAGEILRKINEPI